jgi:hypothetical protein
MTDDGPTLAEKLLASETRLGEALTLRDALEVERDAAMVEMHYQKSRADDAEMAWQLEKDRADKAEEDLRAVLQRIEKLVSD